MGDSCFVGPLIRHFGLANYGNQLNPFLCKDVRPPMQGIGRFASDTMSTAIISKVKATGNSWAAENEEHARRRTSLYPFFNGF